MGFAKAKKYNMNPSSTPANNENVAYGSLLAQSSKLKRSDQVNLVKALAGTLGMIAVFPNQLVVGAGPSPAKAGGGQKSKGPAQRAPTNPLSGSPEKKAFDAAKKAVAKATKDGGGQKLPTDHPMVRTLESAKDHYFRALSSTKGTNAASSRKDGTEEVAAKAAAPSASRTTPTESPPKKEAKTPNSSKKK